MTKRRQKIPNGGKMDQNAIRYTNIFHCKKLQNLHILGIFGLKIYHLATLLARSQLDFAMSILPTLLSVPISTGSG
jgi:hypothetical protein